MILNSGLRFHNCRLIASRLFALLAALILIPAPAAQAACEAAPVVLQVLGSGGPFGNGRASAGYLIWIDGVARGSDGTQSFSSRSLLRSPGPVVAATHGHDGLRPVGK